MSVDKFCTEMHLHFYIIYLVWHHWLFLHIGALLLRYTNKSGF